ncbi:ABC transporter substrate binding protein [Desulfococcaceae bacterium HSG9]|nr:ABC transporter substrate binding protein [Desulfococcaceae bacterium HSG9]
MIDRRDLLSIWIIAAVLTIAADVAVSMAEETDSAKKAVLLFSYEASFWGVHDENKGVVKGLATTGYAEDRNIEIIRLYMNTKSVNKTVEQMETAAIQLVSEIKKTDPDVLFIMDDDALRHAGAKLLDTDLPIVFGGVNFLVTESDYGWVNASRRVPLADSLEKPGHNITGVQEKPALSAGFKLLHQILPCTKNALFISDNSIVGTQLLQVAGWRTELQNAPFHIVDEIYTNSFEKLKKTILEYQDKVDSIILFIPWSLEYKDGKHVPQKEVVSWMLRHNKRPGIAYLDMLAEEGYLCGVVVDMVQQGFHAGVMGGRILNGEKAGNIPITDPVANRITINLARAHQLGIEIPFEVLKSADVVYKKMTAYPEYKIGN